MMAEGDVKLTQGLDRRGDTPGEPTTAAEKFVSFLTREYEAMRRWRTRMNIDDRLTECLRAREGKYTPQQIAEFQKFGGSQVFANMTRNKCRGAASMLRDIFLGRDRAWAIDPTPNPTLPEDMFESAMQLARAEVTALMAQGQQVPEEVIKARMDQVVAAAEAAADRKAKKEAERATEYIDDILTEGAFYVALEEFLFDFVTYPFAVLYGPVAVMSNDVRYVEGFPERVRRPKLVWKRVEPADIWWTPGAANVEEAAVVHRMHLSRADLNMLIGLPGYDDDAILSSIRAYERGLQEPHMESHERDHLQNRDPVMNEGEMIDVLAYTGPIHGRDLDEWGYEVDDLDMDYLVQAWVCGRYLLKIHIDPDPRMRPPYYIASYEPNPGSIVGTALPELIADLQQICNAALRATANNMGIASGPQVVINDDRLADPTESDQIFPWRRWHCVTDPSEQNPRPPVEFFNPQSNAQELITVFQTFSNIADEVSAVPRYLTGGERVGGAGRTASGLSMLMGNATRVMKSVAANVDHHILAPAIQKTYDLVMLTSATDILKGDEKIVVRGATTAEAREMDRMRLLEFLQMTANPIDAPIIGPMGRAVVLKKVADTLGLPGEDIVMTPEQIQAMQAAQAMQAQAQQQGGAPGGSPSNGPQNSGQAPGQSQGGQQPSRPSKPGAGRMGEQTDNMSRTRGAARGTGSSPS